MADRMEQEMLLRQLAEQNAAAMQEQKIIQQQIHNKTHDAELAPVQETAAPVIGKEEVRKAYQVFLEYKDAKANLEKRLSENEEYWKLRHWEMMSEKDDKRIKPKSAWLFNTIINKHADAMDNYPTANILPRARDDEEVAKVLSNVIPVILEQNDFQNVYSLEQWYKLKNGTGVYGVFWNNDKNRGLGDIDIKKIALSKLFWKGEISDIQDSPNLFYVEMYSREQLVEMWPQLSDKVLRSEFSLAEANIENRDERTNHDDAVAVFDWYYKKRVTESDVNGIPKVRTILHYCKFVGEEILYASENDPNYAQAGWYEHGEYPFVFDVLYPVEGSVCGIGLIDLEKDEQLYIDKLQQAILENAVAGARPRVAINTAAGLNEDEFMDLSKPVVHFDGHLGENDYRVIESSPLAPIYSNIYLSKIQEMKDTSGNTASSQGQTSSVTSASGIASLQEAAGKLSRDTNQGSYRAYKKVVYFVIELIREFYDEPRCFRIAGDRGQDEYMSLSNAGLQPQPMGTAPGGLDLGNRLPIMDIDVKPQKESAYTQESQNQTALNLYNMGFFAPTNADASLACLDMMDFDGIEKVRDRVAKNGTLMDMVIQLQQQLAMLMGQINPQAGEAAAQQMESNDAKMARPQGAGAAIQKPGNSLSKQAAAATRESTAPR
jgi:hypothetical protein